MKPERLLMLYAAIVFALLFVGAWWAGGERQKELAQQCGARWAASGMLSRYDQSAGCMVRLGARWLPEGNVKVGP